MNWSIDIKLSSFFYKLLVWAGVILQTAGAFLLACGTVLTIVFFITGADRFVWIVVLLCGAILSANLGLLCVILADKKFPARGTAGDNSLLAAKESGFRRSESFVTARNKSRPNTAVPDFFVSESGTRRQSRLKVVR